MTPDPLTVHGLAERWMAHYMRRLRDAQAAGSESDAATFRDKADSWLKCWERSQPNAARRRS